MRSASSRAGTLSRAPPSRMRSDGPPVLRMFVCPLPTCPSHLLTRSRASAGTIPAHAAAARSSRSAAWTEGLSGPPCRACYDMRRVPHKLARLAVLRSALPRDANDQSTTLWVAPSSTGNTRRRGALGNPGLNLFQSPNFSMSRLVCNHTQLRFQSDLTKIFGKHPSKGVKILCYLPECRLRNHHRLIKKFAD